MVTTLYIYLIYNVLAEPFSSLSVSFPQCLPCFPGETKLMQPQPLPVTLVTFELVYQFKSYLHEVKREVPAHFMKVGGLLTDGCTNSVGHTPVSSCMRCAASGTRNGCCAQSWIPRWLQAGWNPTAMATCFVLCCQCNYHPLPWAVATAEEECCAEGEDLLGRKRRTSPAGIALTGGGGGQRRCLPCPCQLLSHWRT